MKQIIYITLFIMAIIVHPGFAAGGDHKTEAAAGADLVSSYVWRGIYQTGASVQPSLSVSAAGFRLGAWGSTDFSTPFKEFDLSLFYGAGGFSAGVTDYWWSGQGAPYFDYRGEHMLEGTAGYHFGERFPLSLSWSTMFFGDQDLDEQGERMYSSYAEIAYGFGIGKMDCSAGVGITPWRSIYNDEFNVTCVSLKVSKQIGLTEQVRFPLFVQAVFNPAGDDANLIVGVTF